LLSTDLLLESFLQLVAQSPLTALRAPLWLLGGKARLKGGIADRVELDPALMPVNETVLAFIRAEKARGRRVYLASASDRRYVESLAARIGMFDGVFATES